MATISPALFVINPVPDTFTGCTVHICWSEPVRDAYAFTSTAMASDTQAGLIDNQPAFVLTICLSIAVALIVGLLAGILYRHDGASIVRAILLGSGAMGAALTISAAFITLLALLS
ncbi:hypothetical protein [Nocardia asiatica]|uniref:hypothetical protein n=1 Tax=Nocardia asiatica TaxID=209252 RepID=UPI003EE11F7C